MAIRRCRAEHRSWDAGQWGLFQTRQTKVACLVNLHSLEGSVSKTRGAGKMMEGAIDQVGPSFHR